MSPISDAGLERLRRAADAPDFSGTRYELLEPLGRGGMGAVYLARDRELGRELALKVLGDPDPAPAAVDRLLAEARIIARLEHPGIVPVHDAGRLPDGRVYYAMKRVSGTRLDALVRQGPPLVERLRLFERVCETVAFAHASGVIHRDLKPENVMVGAFGEVLVMDWGLAKLQAEEVPAPLGGVPAGSTATQEGTVQGTPGYMSPEQARGEIGAIDARSDVFALGALLHFLLTGTPPASAPSGHGLAPTRPDPAVPAALAAACRHAMALDPAQRYASATEFGAEIQRYLSGAAVHAYRENALQRLARLGRRYRTPIALVGAYLLMRLLLVLFARR